METSSPYCPPASTDDQPLTRFQKACLRNVLDRRRNPSKVRFLLRQWPAVLGYAVISVCLFASVYTSASNLSAIYLTGAFTIGVFVASVATLLGECIRQLRLWPAIDRVIDWEELERLAE